MCAGDRVNQKRAAADGATGAASERRARLDGARLGIAFHEERDGYLHTEELPGARSFALWPLAQAWLELDVDDVARATAELEACGYRMLVKNRTEPWGQTVSRLLSPEGLLLGISFTPALRDPPAR